MILAVSELDHVDPARAGTGRHRVGRGDDLDGLT
jgi:hypothetical protein